MKNTEMPLAYMILDSFCYSSNQHVFVVFTSYITQVKQILTHLGFACMILMVTINLQNIQQLHYKLERNCILTRCRTVLHTIASPITDLFQLFDVLARFSRQICVLVEIDNHVCMLKASCAATAFDCIVVTSMRKERPVRFELLNFVERNMFCNQPLILKFLAVWVSKFTTHQCVPTVRRVNCLIKLLLIQHQVPMQPALAALLTMTT